MGVLRVERQVAGEIGAGNERRCDDGGTVRKEYRRFVPTWVERVSQRRSRVLWCSVFGILNACHVDVLRYVLNKGF